MKIFNIFFVLSILFQGHISQARVFMMGKEKFGSYLRSSYWPWTNAETPFSQSSGTATTIFSDSFTNLVSYEFGMIYNTGASTWRFGIEIIQPPQVSDASGKNAAQTKLFTYSSSIAVVIPKVGLEFNLKTWKESRFWAYFDYGLANLTLQNIYKFTATGTAAYGISDFREEIKGNQAEYSGALGIETLMSDTTTICLEAGYRVLDFTAMTHNLAITNFQGAQSVGSTAYQNNGTTARDLNMTSPYAALSFRIWIQ